MPIYVSAASMEQFTQNQLALPNTMELKYLDTPWMDRKTRVYNGHTYTKQGKQGLSISLPWRIAQAFVAFSTTAVGFLTFGLINRNHGFHRLHKHAWMQLTTGKKWQSLYLKIEPPVVQTVIRTTYENVRLPMNFAPIDTPEKIHAFLLTANDLNLLQFIAGIASQNDERMITEVLRTIGSDDSQMMAYAQAISHNHEMIKWTFDFLLREHSQNSRDKLSKLSLFLNLHVLPWDTFMLVQCVTSDQWPQGYDSQLQEASASLTISHLKVLRSLKSNKEYSTFCTFMPDKEKVWKVMTSHTSTSSSIVFIKGVFSQSITGVDPYILEKYLERLWEQVTNSTDRKEDIEMIAEACKLTNLENLNLKCIHYLYMILWKRNINLFKMATVPRLKFESYLEYVDRTFPQERAKLISYIIEDVRHDHYLVGSIKRHLDDTKAKELFSYQIDHEIYDLFPLYLKEYQFVPCLEMILQSPRKYRNFHEFFETLTQVKMDPTERLTVLDKCKKFILDTKNNTLIEHMNRACEIGKAKGIDGEGGFLNIAQTLALEAYTQQNWNPENIRKEDYRLWGPIYACFGNDTRRQSELFNIMLDEYRKVGGTEQELRDDLKASLKQRK